MSEPESLLWRESGVYLSQMNATKTSNRQEPLFGEYADRADSLNRQLSRHRDIPAETANGVRALARDLNTESGPSHWEHTDPDVRAAIAWATLGAMNAIAAGERDDLRVALERIRQNCRRAEEFEAVDDARSDKELVRWLIDTTGLSQREIAALLDVPLRTFQRWASTATGSSPEPADARRLRTIARIVNQLRFSLTPAGAIEWFDWPREDLMGKTPRSLLGDASMLPVLMRAAVSMRSTIAS